MRAIWFLATTCVLALVVVGCGASLGPDDEGLELLPSAAQPPQPEPAPPSTVAEEGFDPLEDDLLESEAVEPLEPELEPEALPVNPFTEGVRLLLRGRSVRIAVTATNTLPGGEEFQIRTDGTFNVRAHIGATGVDGSNLIRKLGDQGAVALGFVPGQLVFTERRVYLNYEELPATVPDQLPWAEASFKQLTGRPQWPDQGAVSALALTTPAHVAALLTASRKTLVEIGRQPIRGASATHYQAVADLAKVSAAAPEPVRGALRGQMRVLATQLGTSELPIDVWLDAKGRLRRVQIDLGAAAAAAETVSDTREQQTPEESPAGESPAGESAPEESTTEQPGSTEEPPPDGVADDATQPSDPAEPTPGAEGAERALEGKAEPVEPGPPTTVLVIDFIAFGGRVRAEPPSEEEIAAYAQVAALSRNVGATLDG